ncbi:unnamed protein product, partial [Ectocarpus sp. 12 AP-2014]
MIAHEQTMDSPWALSLMWAQWAAHGGHAMSRIFVHDAPPMVMPMGKPTMPAMGCSWLPMGTPTCAAHRGQPTTAPWPLGIGCIGRIAEEEEELDRLIKI